MSIPFIGKLFGSGIKETAKAIGGLVKDIRSAITGKLPPEEQAKVDQKLAELETNLTRFNFS